MSYILRSGFLIAALSSNALAQSSGADKTLAERLGYPRDAKLLIVNDDDLGMTHSVNAAAITALNAGAIRSGSIMIPCPWVSEIATYARAHPDGDLGLHLTLTSEWPPYRWGPLLSRDRAPSLTDRNGYLYQSAEEAIAHVDPRDAELEVRAQIERARTLGIHPTHLDTHMGVMFGSPALFEVLLTVARENALPARVAKDFLVSRPALAALILPSDVVIDRRVSIEAGLAPARWLEFYTKAIRALRPGVTEMIVHLAHDDEEMRAATVGHPDWGAAWRQRDFDFFMSPTFKRLVRENGVTLVTWREIGKLVVNAPKSEK